VAGQAVVCEKKFFSVKHTTFQKIHRTESPQFTEQNRHNSPNETATIHRTEPPQFTERNRHNSPNETATIHRTEPPQFTEWNRHNSPNLEEEIFIKLLNIIKLYVILQRE